MNDLHPIDRSMISTLIGAASIVLQTEKRQRPAVHKAKAFFAPGSPHKKRVAKDRARRKATKKHKQKMRREGKL